ncbi:translationally-controlled tumor-like protein [Gregarina niphandrodes]|uniref:Translationally-controlled tumor-like protein n=1 Tax=Gregarina niphandrodes TaxID=110365 RepID=A0A023B796_GRENI|nr:translationally-controlled tumor-like protein [Gregarina niphandrodes]EZG67154.1 translationally-controlled tumor-like protein [Gregarina niphandrodes]|eukprot:XP_011130323.1 translationally-controlled tumor-like protein [Gregarina niphandrodes]
MVQVFIDVSCGSELVSDGYPMAPAFENPEFEQVAFEVKSRMTVKGGEDFGISCNVDEDAGEGATGDGEQAVEKVNDIVDAFQLVSLGSDKKFFKGYFASYMKSVLLPAVPEAEVAEFKTKIQSLFVKMMAEFENGELFQAEKANESEDPLKCMPIFAYWAGEEEAPRFVFFKHGLKVEKY